MLTIDYCSRLVYTVDYCSRLVEGCDWSQQHEEHMGVRVTAVLTAGGHQGPLVKSQI